MKTFPDLRPTTSFRTNAILYLVLVLMICLTVLGGVAVWQERDARADEVSLAAADPAEGDVPTETYDAVLDAARTEALAFVNIDHTDLDAAIDKVRQGATGPFKKQYEKSAKGLRQVMKRNKSQMTGEVLSAGVVAITEFTATVLVATKGNVTNSNTKGKPVERNLRLKLDLKKVDGKWLTNNLEFVG